MNIKNVPEQRRGEDRVKSILHAASRLIIKNRSFNFSLKELTVEAGCSVGSLYHFFSNKEEVIVALFEEHLEKLRLILLTIDRITPAQWMEYETHALVIALVGPSLRYGSENQDFLILCIYGFPYESKLGHELAQLVENLYHRVVSLALPNAPAEMINIHWRMLNKVFDSSLRLCIELSHSEQEILNEGIIMATAYLDKLKRRYQK